MTRGRPDVAELNDAVDLLWLRLAQCYSGFVVMMLGCLALSELVGAPLWLTLLAFPALGPFLVQAIRVQRKIWDVRRRTAEERRRRARRGCHDRQGLYSQDRSGVGGGG